MLKNHIKSYIKIIIAGTAGTIATRTMGYDSFTLSGFVTFMLVFISISLVWHLLTERPKYNFNFNLKKILVGVGVVFTLLISFLYFILWQYQHTTPHTLLDENRTLNKFYSEVVTFNPYVSNSAYRMLRHNFVEHLVQFNVTSEQKEQIWKNYLKLFILQTKIRNLLIQIKVDILDNKISYGYEYNYGKAKVTPFYINSFITTFNNHNEGASIPSSYDKKPIQKLNFKAYGGGIVRADLPYFNNSIPINKKHINKIKLIHKMNKLSYDIIEINNSLVITK